MCGIAGIHRFDPQALVTAPELRAMLRPIAHRGPDGDGLLASANTGLAHCRLAIIDLAGGAQPLGNEDGSIQIVFNGEIYNYRELRAGLLARGHRFHTHSDTEVIVHLYEEHGPDCVRRLDGMFAFAIWDAPRRRLLLARDRTGIKPLYYCATASTLYFASELKALLTCPGVPRDLDEDALHRCFEFLYVPGEATLFRAIRKLPPAHVLLAEPGRWRTQRYWELSFTPRFAGSFEDAAAQLRDLLERTVRSHLIADVPVGVLLSGGVDSSAVLSLAAAQTPFAIDTFTIGFADRGIVDERPFARLAAERCGARHREITITADDFWHFLPDFAWHMEEPVCEPPAVALHHVARLARGHVKVLLSGEGGDEAFAGYPNYAHQLRLARLERALGPVARPLGAVLSAAGSATGSDRARRYGAALGRPLAQHYFGRTATPASFFHAHNRDFFASPWDASGDAASATARRLASLRGEHRLAQMLALDTATWLPDDLLVKADKMTMANSLELRVPLLDHHVLEFAASLPPDFKVRGRATKRVFKAAISSLVPPRLLARRKAGFPVPYDAWLRGPLADRVRDTLLSSRSLARGLYHPRPLERLLDTHIRHGGYGKEVFTLLAVEFWHRQFVDAIAPGAPLTPVPPRPPVPALVS